MYFLMLWRDSELPEKNVRINNEFRRILSYMYRAFSFVNDIWIMDKAMNYTSPISHSEINNMTDRSDLVTRLRKRAEIRRGITNRKQPETDRISDLLEEAANEIERLNRRDNI